MIEIMSDDLPEMLRGLATRSRNLGAGEFLFRRGDAVRSLFLVEAGEVHLVRLQSDGSHLVLQRAAVGQIVAEASVFSAAYHCDATAMTASRVADIDRGRFRSALVSVERLADAWNHHLAREVQTTRLRAEILSLRKVSARLDAWLSLRSGKLPEKGEWKILAAEIGVTPEALYRELARRGQ